MEFEIIDFHTHPFIKSNSQICVHKPAVQMTADSLLESFKTSGVSLFCGTVIRRGIVDNDDFENIIKESNDDALELYDYYKGAYYPGCMIHPFCVEESKRQIDRFCEKGLKLMGEIVPWSYKYNHYNTDEMNEIVDYATKKGMIMNIHPEDDDDMDEFVKRHKDMIIVGAHPSENVRFDRHVQRAKNNDNYYIDVSGGGIQRYACARHLVNEIGADKVVFGSDFPISNLHMYVDGIKNDPLLTDNEKQLILSGNAKRILNIK